MSIGLTNTIKSFEFGIASKTPSAPSSANETEIASFNGLVKDMINQVESVADEFAHQPTNDELISSNLKDLPKR